MPIEIPSARVSLEGIQSSMKTSTALTAPYPSILFAFDGGFERAIFGKKAKNFVGLDIKVIEYDPKVKADVNQWRGHDITIFRLPRPIQTDPIRKQGYVALWNYFNDRIAKAASDSESLKSVIVDTMTLARETRADAHLQAYQDNTRLGQNMRTNLTQIEYGVVNESIKDVYLNYESTGINLIANHHLTDEYKNLPETQSNGSVEIKSKPTGEIIMQGYAKTYQYVDMALRMQLVEKDPRAKPGEFGAEAHSKATFKKCGYNPDLQGVELMDVTWNSLMYFIELNLGGNIALPKSRIGAD